MIELTKSQRKYIYTNNHGCIEVNGINYYFKLSPKSYRGIEATVEKLAKMVGLKCAHYEYVTIGEYDYCLSEDLSDGGMFYTADALHVYDDSLYGIWEFIDDHFPDRSIYLMNQIVKIYLFDILIMNSDRNASNYGFKFWGDKDGEFDDIYIFDNELSFEAEGVVLSSKFSCSDKLREPTSIKDIPAGNEKIVEELDYFLETSSEEFYNMFLEMYNILTPEVVEAELKKYNSKFDIYLMRAYKENYEIIGKLLKKRGLK